MEGLRLPPVIEEVFDQSDEPCDLKEKPTMLDSLMVEEKHGGMAADGDKAQEKEVTEEKAGASEELDWEELRAQLFHILLELEETREVSLRYQQDYLELQGQLEEERLLSAEQAETFSRQIQSLKGQLCSVQEQTERLQEQRQLELRWAEEEVLLLQQSAQEAAEERENDIASLQEQLCRLSAQLQQLRATVQEYELELASLRAEIGVRSQSQDLKAAGDVLQLQDHISALTDQRARLSSSNMELMARVEHLQKQAEAWVLHPAALLCVNSKCEDVSSTIGAQDTALTLSVCSSDLEVLKVQLRQVQEKAERVQKQCDGLKDELTELQQSYDSIQQDRQLLEAELHHCRTELNRLMDKKAQSCTRPPDPPLLSFPSVGLVVIVGLVWCWWEELASAQSKAASWNLLVGAVAMAAVAILLIPSLPRA